MQNLCKYKFISGILLTDEDFWREQRRFIVRHLRDFGLGKTSHMESIIMKEVEALTDFFSNAISKTYVSDFFVVLCFCKITKMNPKF